MRDMMKKKKKTMMSGGGGGSGGRRKSFLITWYMLLGVSMAVVLRSYSGWLSTLKKQSTTASVLALSNQSAINAHELVLPLNNAEGDLSPTTLSLSNTSFSQQYDNTSQPQTIEWPYPRVSHEKKHSFDPFRLWTKWGYIPEETISGVLDRVTDPSCRNSTVYRPSSSVHHHHNNNHHPAISSSLEQLADAILRKWVQFQFRSSQQTANNGNITDGTGSTAHIVIAVLGSSVSAPRDGWVAALRSYLFLSPIGTDLTFEVRNFAVGATGPRFTYYCNQLRGDEDIVVFEGVRGVHEEGDALLQLASSLQNRGYGVILVNWRSPDGPNYQLNSPTNGWAEAAEALNLPLITTNGNRDFYYHCLPSNNNSGDFSTSTIKDLLYKDDIHPNAVGEMMIATLVGQLLETAMEEHALNQSNNSSFDLLTYNSSSNDLLQPRRVISDSSNAPICYDKLQCSMEEKEIGLSRCLNVSQAHGFELRSNSNGKTWWEGTIPGHSVEIIIDEPCVEIIIFHNLRVTNGMVKVLVDGKVLNGTNSPLEGGILDGWYEGLWWLPKSRALLKESIIATNLESSTSRPHTLHMTIQNVTHSEDGTFKFDFTSLACVTAESKFSTDGKEQLQQLEQRQ